MYLQGLLIVACLPQGLISVCGATNEPAGARAPAQSNVATAVTRRLSPNDVIQMKVYLEEDRCSAASYFATSTLPTLPTSLNT